MKREFYSLSGKLLKTMYFKDVKNYHGRLRPSFMLIQNQKNQLYKTEILLMEMIEANNLRISCSRPHTLDGESLGTIRKEKIIWHP